MADLQKAKSVVPDTSITLARGASVFESWAGPTVAMIGAIGIAMLQYRAGWDTLGADAAVALLVAGTLAGMLGRQAKRRADAARESYRKVIAEKSALADRISAIASELSRHEQVFEAVLDSMTEAVVLVDRELRPIKLNPPARAGFERARTSFENWITCSELKLLEDRKRTPFNPEDSPIRRALRGETVERIRLHVIGDRAGEQWYEASGRPIRGIDGAIEGALLVYRDIVDTVGAEHGRALLASVFESAPDAIMSTDVQGRITSWNAGAERLFGYGAEEAEGHSIEMLMAPEYPWVLPELARRRELHQYDTRLVGKGSASIDVSISASPIRTTRGRVVGFAIVCRDNTMRKRAEEELERARDLAVEAARLRSEFLANMSHEIRTPLNGIVGTTELLSDTGLTEEQHEYTQTITASGRLLLSIVDDILDFSKLAAGKVRFERIGFDLHEVVEAAMDSFAEPAHQKRIELLCTMASDVPQFVVGDPTRLRQVLNNLIGNAIKFTAGGEVAIGVTNLNSGDAGQNDASSANLRFEVRDTGIGIRPEAREWLFQPFSQADGSTSRKFGGTGLGLAISARLVEGMGGRIDVASEPGAGASFFFALPLARQNRRIPASVDPAILRGLQALVVDDNATNRMIVSSQLASWGVAADSAAGGTEALVAMRQRAAAGRPFDLVVTDMHMPGLDGLTLARAIRADPRLASTRIVVMSSLASKPARNTGHVDLWINKPLMPPRLLARLCALFNPGMKRACDLPASIGGPAEAVLPSAQSAFNGGRILVVEDNSINRRLALLQLRKLGYASEAVEDAGAALEMVGHESFVLILMDCELPGVDGYHATREIRRREGSLKHTIIVAMTAHAIEGARERCLEAGMDDYIAKPITLARLKTMLERWIHPPIEMPHQSADVSFSGHRDSASIDQSVANGLRALGGADQEVMRNVIGVYQKELPERLRRMHRMLDAGESDALAAESHSLKSVCTGMGFIRMTLLCADLERFAGGRNLPSARAILTLLEQECGSVRPQLEALRAAGKVT